MKKSRINLLIVCFLLVVCFLGIKFFHHSDYCIKNVNNSLTLDNYIFVKERGIKKYIDNYFNQEAVIDNEYAKKNLNFIGKKKGSV
jgi:hypothetical protein